MTSRSSSLLRTIFGLSLAVFFLYLAFRDAHWEELWNSFEGVNYWWVALFVVLAALSHFFRAYRWKYLLSPIKMGISVHKLFSAVMIGYLINNFVPRAGELARAYVIGKSEGVPKSAALGTVVVERILDLVSFVFILCLVLFFFPSSIEVLIEDAEKFRPLFLAGSIGALLLFGWLFLKSEKLFGLLKNVRYLAPKKYATRIEAIIDSFVSGFKIASSRKYIWQIAISSLLMWLCYILTLYVTFFAFDAIRALELDISAAIILLIFSTAAFILPAPGAFGTYHSFLTLALVKLYGVDNSTALSYSVLTHEIGFLFIVVVGVFYLLKDHLKISELRNEASTG